MYNSSNDAFDLVTLLYLEIKLNMQCTTIKLWRWLLWFFDNFDKDQIWVALFCFVSLRFASCTQCCLCLWIVHSCLPLWFSLTFIRSASCTQCCLCLWIVHSCLPLWFSLTFIRSASCTQCCLCIWILYSCLSLRFSLTFIINVQLWIIMRILF
jgi:hypothetical protein